jgi:hypothetical protein
MRLWWGEGGFVVVVVVVEGWPRVLGAESWLVTKGEIVRAIGNTNAPFSRRVWWTIIVEKLFGSQIPTQRLGNYFVVGGVVGREELKGSTRANFLVEQDQQKGGG